MASSKVERSGKLQWIPLGMMRVSPLAQREIKQSRVDKLVANFDLEQLGYPTLNHRGDHWYIIDGQHRVEALKEWLGGDWEKQHMHCYVYEGLREQEEAEKFDRLNDVLIVSAFDRFKVRVTAGRPVETDVYRIVYAQDLKISRDKIPGAIGSVSTLRNIYTRSDGETLAKSLRIIRDAYGDSGFEAKVIDGIGHLCQRYNGLLDEDRAVERLRNMHGGVKGLLGRAEVLHKQTGNTKAHCVAAAAVDVINSKRGGRKLASWWSAEA